MSEENWHNLGSVDVLKDPPLPGGQDNIQAVAGQMLGFFAETGFAFPPFPYIAHSRGWTAEDMESNIEYVENSDDLKEGAKDFGPSLH